MKQFYSFLVFSLLTFTMVVETEAGSKATKCKMSFDLASWSVIYKQGKGSGVITCSNGQTQKVRIETHGGGITFGKSKMVDGKATFSEVYDIEELYGGYAMADAHAGAGESAEAHVMTKGNVSMSIAGKGKGVNVGFSFGSFSIHPQK